MKAEVQLAETIKAPKMAEGEAKRADEEAQKAAAESKRARDSASLS